MVTHTVSLLLLLVLSGSVCIAQNSHKGVDRSKMVVVLPFETSVTGPAGLPEATRAAVIQTMKDDAVFAAVLTPEEAKDKDTATLLQLTGRLVDLEKGSAAKRLAVGFGTGRAHAAFEFTVKDSTGDIVWQKTIKQTASFWFNSTTSSAAERAELPEGVAQKLVKELKKEK